MSGDKSSPGIAEHLQEARRLGVLTAYMNIKPEDLLLKDDVQSVLDASTIAVIKAYLASHKEILFLSKYQEIPSSDSSSVKVPNNIYKLPNGVILAEVKKISGGTSGEVFEAIDITSGIKYALKKIRSNVESDIETEVELMRLQYEGIIELYDGMFHVINVADFKIGIMPLLSGTGADELFDAALRQEAQTTPAAQSTQSQTTAPKTNPNGASRKRASSVEHLAVLEAKRAPSPSVVEVEPGPRSPAGSVVETPERKTSIVETGPNLQDAIAGIYDKFFVTEVEDMGSITTYKHQWLGLFANGVGDKINNSLGIINAVSESRALEWGADYAARTEVAEVENVDDFLASFDKLTQAALHVCVMNAVMLARGYIERDLKLQNMYMHGELALPLDKGEAILLPSQSEVAFVDSVTPRGTPGYLSSYNEALHAYVKSNYSNIVNARKMLGLYYALIEIELEKELKSCDLHLPVFPPDIIKKIAEAKNTQDIVELENSLPEEQRKDLQFYRDFKGAKTEHSIREFGRKYKIPALEDKKFIKGIFSKTYPTLAVFNDPEVIAKLQRAATKPPYVFNAQSDASSVAVMIQKLAALYIGFTHDSLNKHEILPNRYVSAVNDPLIALFNQYVRICKKLATTNIENTYTVIEALQDLLALRKRVANLQKARADLADSRHTTSKLTDIAAPDGIAVAASGGSSEALWQNTVLSLAVDVPPEQYEVKVVAEHNVVVKSKELEQPLVSLRLEDDKVVTKCAPELTANTEANREVIAAALLAHAANSDPADVLVLGNGVDAPDDAIAYFRIGRELGIKVIFDDATEVELRRLGRIDNDLDTELNFVKNSMRGVSVARSNEIEPGADAAQKPTAELIPRNRKPKREYKNPTRGP